MQINSCWHTVNSTFVFFNFLEFFFFQNIFDPWLIESQDAETVDTQEYSDSSLGIYKKLL